MSNSVDLGDPGDSVASVASGDSGEVPDQTVASVVTMKLNTFCTNQAVVRTINQIVLAMNRLVAEAYTFSNFHVIRLLQGPSPVVIPLMDRNFFYRCLLAVSMVPGKQTVAALSITMATMATNHLWMNLEGRLTRYIRKLHPGLRRHEKRILRAVVTHPKEDLTKVFKMPAAAVVGGGAGVDAAMRLCTQLRLLMPLQSGKQYATRAHLTLPLYHKILLETEAARDRFEGFDDPASRKAMGAFRLFKLLPTKSGFTTSFIPISTMAMLHMLRSLGLEELIGDGRSMDATGLWRKYFNLNAVETRTRRFGGSIVTDGTGVSVLMAKPAAAATCKCDEPCCAEMRTVLREREIARVVGVDPGFTDVVTVATADGSKPVSYSSKRYYEDAKIFLSNRRTDSWNEGTEDMVDSIPTVCTGDLVRLKLHVTAYLAHLQALLRYRFTKGYRNMRFMRSVFKRKAVGDICSLIAPAGKITLVGFGNWSGGKGSPISRRTCGPLQEIKFRLRRRPDVFLKELDEYRTSVTCNGCLQVLSNMRAMSTVVDRYDQSKAVRRTRVHKVLHCRSSDGGPSNRCGASWNRDVNASRNLLMLMMCHVLGYERPPAFTRAWQTPSATQLTGSAIYRIARGFTSSGEL
ncbi:hypothetical protein TSOC_012543 [Tetrabaena socialis]|uniref:Uncharacterized protein n=1 Tax=Tetrabaena socialis TaxID=47790 RepID=A0A2J7ZMR8_9CHLO|nr:hypothetical protein TSOC_012543 [Tetrabaena socialis]|eukprot:PNH01563.1 hypothetical protein TSOC_012543 [Tetrabaena socialis]